MKAYIQSELAGDEDSVVIDCAILQCVMWDNVFDALKKFEGAPVNRQRGSSIAEVVDEAIRKTLSPYIWDASIECNGDISFVSMEVELK